MNRLLALGILAALLSGCGPQSLSQKVWLDTWTNGRIKLASGASITEIENVTFSVDGKEITSTQMGDFKWVEFKKDKPDPLGSFEVVYTTIAIESTHVQLSRPTQGPEECPNWGQKIFGKYCQSTAFSVP